MDCLGPDRRGRFGGGHGRGDELITFRDGTWIVWSSDVKVIMGRYDTRKKAEAALVAREMWLITHRGEPARRPGNT